MPRNGRKMITSTQPALAQPEILRRNRSAKIVISNQKKMTRRKM